MTLTELRYIVAVAQEKHFGRAAEKCFVSQPTLSVAIKKLEDELNIKIFERYKTDVRVTLVGQKIVEQAQDVLEQAEEIKTIAHGGRDELSIPLRIGAIYTIGPYIFPHIIHDLKHNAPQMPAYIRDGYTAELRNLLRQGDLDAIIIALPFTEPGVEIEELYSEQFKLVLPKNHELTKKDKVSVTDLDNEKVLLLGKNHCFRDQVVSYCPNCLNNINSDPNLTMMTEGSSLETLRCMVASGIGITILPQSAINTHSEADLDLVVKDFVKPIPERTVALVWRKGFTRMKAIATLKAAILSCEI